jgi:FixJ family two-component response regulator
MVSPGNFRCVAIVDDDAPVRDALLELVDEAGFSVFGFASSEEFMAGPRNSACTNVPNRVR